MQVIMKFSGVSRHYHRPKKGGGTRCGLTIDPHLWGTFEIPDVLLEALPACVLCQRAAADQDKKAQDKKAKK